MLTGRELAALAIQLSFSLHHFTIIPMCSNCSLGDSSIDFFLFQKIAEEMSPCGAIVENPKVFKDSFAGQSFIVNLCLV